MYYFIVSGDDDDEFRFNDASTHEGHLRQNGELTWFCSETIIMISHNVSGEISVYLMKIKVVSITSELISYHFTTVNDTIYIFTLHFGRLRFSSLFQKWMLPPFQIFEQL